MAQRKKKAVKKVAKKKPANQTSFKKGNKAAAVKGKGKGTPRYDRETLISKKIDNVTITNYMTLNSHLTPEELIMRLKNEKVSTLESMIIKSLLKGYRTGDIIQLSFFLDRLIGKVPNQIEHSVKNKFDDMSIEELLAEKRRVSEINRRNMTWNEQNHERSKEQLEVAIEIEANTRDIDTGD